MWTFLVRFILRYRFFHLLAFALITGLMAYKASFVEISYDMYTMLPESDSTLMMYRNFKQTFGEDGNVFFAGIKDERLYDLELFNAWADLAGAIKQVDEVKEVVSIGGIYVLDKDTKARKFDFRQLTHRRPATQEELDSLIRQIHAFPFYEGLIYNKETGATLMAITLKEDKLNTKRRIYVVNQIRDILETFSNTYDVKVHYSGLPYIRTKTTQKVQNELRLFVLLAAFIASVALLSFFRSLKAMLFPMIIVGISVVWGLGFMVIVGYKISILTGIIPPLIIVIGVENCIFLLNKYHYEFRNHGNKIKALSRVVQRVGYATLLTNLTTAVGFGAFIVTGNRMLVEFGVVASASILFIFILCLFLIPIVYSYLPPPKVRHLKHLENKMTVRILEKILHWVQYKRNIIYLITMALLVLGIVGMTRLQTTGQLVSDIPHRDPIYQDLMFFEKEFKGILPFEISIDTRKPKGVMRLATIEKINQLQDSLKVYPELSRALSVAEVAKFARQAFYNGNPSFYSLPTNQEKNFIFSYIPDPEPGKRGILHNLVDTTFQVTRISVQMANIGTKDIRRIKDDLVPTIHGIFPPDQYDVHITGTSVVFLKGTEYLVKNLLWSLLLAVCAISIIMAMLFTSYKMVGVSIITNLIPQFLTAAMMGFFLIAIKPSTILIFSIALGISVDNTIHFLSRYRMDLRLNNWNIKASVLSALRETGFSMVYSSIVLFLGFGIFTLSGFGGTQAMGFLISFTLITAVLSNLLVLPSLLLSLDRRITTRTFKEPLLEIFDEEEDIDLDSLEIEEPDTRGSA